MLKLQVTIGSNKSNAYNVVWTIQECKLHHPNHILLIINQNKCSISIIQQQLDLIIRYKYLFLSIGINVQPNRQRYSKTSIVI